MRSKDVHILPKKLLNRQELEKVYHTEFTLKNGMTRSDLIERLSQCVTPFGQASMMNNYAFEILECIVQGK
jgi:hypothetical protein